MALKGQRVCSADVTVCSLASDTVQLVTPLGLVGGADSVNTFWSISVVKAYNTPAAHLQDLEEVSTCNIFATECTH